MKKYKITGILNVIKKLPLSKMGNPKYRVEINNEIFETRTNASLGYSVTNFDNKKVTATVTRFGLGLIGGLYEIEDFFKSKNKEVTKWKNNT